MNEHVRPGHVSRDRLLGEGSAFVRQLSRAQQEAAHQTTQLADACQEGNDGASDEPDTARVLTFNELWNARTTANHVGVCVAEFADRLLDTHLWWPQAQGSSAHKAAAAAATAGTTSSTSAKHQLVQESLAQDRLLQHQGRGRGWRASGRYKSKKEYQADQELAAGRGLATMLLGDPRNIHQQHPPTNSRSMVHLASPCGGDLQDWVCCNKPYPDNALEPTRLTEAVASVDACGCENSAAAVRCQECGAPRWDGHNGQLQQRLLAVLQTADLSSVGTKQLAARLTAESGSLPALGLQLQPDAVQQGVQAFLDRRRAAIAASESEATAPYSDTTSPADTVAFSLAPAVRGVHQQLVSWHLEQLNKKQLWTQPQQQPHQQQQQQQHSWDSSEQQAQQVQLHDHGHLEAAAATAAALTPQLLTGVFRERNNNEQASSLKPIRMHNRGYPVVYTWVADVLQQAAVAAASRSYAAHKPRSNSQSASPSLSSPSSSLSTQRFPGLRRPLPPSTLQQLLDRKSAVLRQAVIDCAQQIADQGKLPVVRRTTSLADSAGEGEGSELLTEEMAVKDWLWSKKKGHYYQKNCQYKSKLPAEDCNGDVPTVVRITCDDWQTVTSIRRHMLHVLTAWHQLATPGAPSAALMTTVERDLHEIQLQQWLIARWQQLTKAWGSASVMSLRPCLAVWDAQQSHLTAPEQQGQPTRFTSTPPRQKQQQPVQHPGSSTPSAGAPSRQSQPMAVQTQQAQQTGKQQQQQQRSRKRGRQQQVEAAFEPQQQQQQQQQQRCKAPQRSRLPRSAAAAAGSSSVTADDRNTSVTAAAADCDESSWTNSSIARNSDSHSDDQSRRAAVQGQQKCRRRTSRQRQSSTGRQGAASRQELPTDDEDEHMTEFDMFLEGVDDLLVPDAADTFEAAGRPSAAWTAVGDGTRTTRHARAATSAVGVREEHAALPAGVRAVLRQAAASGTSAAVLHRTTARLQLLASSPHKYGNTS